MGQCTPGLSSGQAPEGTCRRGREGQLGPWVEVQPHTALLLGPDHPETLLFPHLRNGNGDLPRLTRGTRKVTLTDCSMQDVCARGSRISCVAAKAPRAFWPRLSRSAPAAPPPRQAFPLLALDSYTPFLFLPTCPVGESTATPTLQGGWPCAGRRCRLGRHAEHFLPSVTATMTGGSPAARTEGRRSHSSLPGEGVL